MVRQMRPLVRFSRPFHRVEQVNTANTVDCALEFAKTAKTMQKVWKVIKRGAGMVGAKPKYTGTEHHLAAWWCYRRKQYQRITGLWC